MALALTGDAVLGDDLALADFVVLAADLPTVPWAAVFVVRTCVFFFWAISVSLFQLIPGAGLPSTMGNVLARFRAAKKPRRLTCASTLVSVVSVGQSQRSSATTRCSQRKMAHYAGHCRPIFAVNMPAGQSLLVRTTKNIDGGTRSWLYGLAVAN